MFADDQLYYRYSLETIRYANVDIIINIHVFSDTATKHFVMLNPKKSKIPFFWEQDKYQTFPERSELNNGKDYVEVSESLGLIFGRSSRFSEHILRELSLSLLYPHRTYPY